MRVVGDIEQHLGADPGRVPALCIATGLWREDYHQLLGMQPMADQPRQVVAGDTDGSVDFAGVEVDRFDP
ncbi:hypothetical protein D3C87_2188630 [compost metagenome]